MYNSSIRSYSIRPCDGDKVVQKVENLESVPSLFCWKTFFLTALSYQGNDHVLLEILVFQNQHISSLLQKVKKKLFH